MLFQQTISDGYVEIKNRKKTKIRVSTFFPLTMFVPTVLLMVDVRHEWNLWLPVGFLKTVLLFYDWRRQHIWKLLFNVAWKMRKIEYMNQHKRLGFLTFQRIEQHPNNNWTFDLAFSLRMFALHPRCPVWTLHRSKYLISSFYRFQNHRNSITNPKSDPNVLSWFLGVPNWKKNNYNFISVAYQLTIRYKQWKHESTSITNQQKTIECFPKYK